MFSNYIVDYNRALREFNNLDEFSKNKIKFLEEKKYADTTKQNYWSMFNNNVHDLEIMYNKDLAMFNEMEVLSIIKTKMSTDLSTIASFKSLINGYEEWALEVGLNPTYNPCSNWGTREIAIINDEKIRKNYISIDDLFALWDKTKDRAKIITVHEFAIVLLARLGLKGSQYKELRYLKMQDIDLDSYIINVTDRDQDNLEDVKVVKKINIDKRILDVLIQANKQEYMRKKAYHKISEEEFVDTEYILKSTKGRVIDQMAIRKGIIDFFTEVDREYIPAKDLFRNAEIDTLIKIKRTKKWNKLDMKDFVEVIEEYELKKSYNIALKLKDLYIKITGDDDIIYGKYSYDENGNRIILD